MLLICDCGSTKAEWALLKGEKVFERFVTEGFNPNFCDEEMLNQLIVRVLQIVDNQFVTKLSFYGSGCGSQANRQRVSALLKNYLPKAEIMVYPDTLAACHALFGKDKGVACILGTGSNACVYDGVNITQSIASLGYMIGDEGSGCHIGKRIVHDYFLGLMPKDIQSKFDEKYHLDRDSFLKRVYQGEQPSRYLAEFSRFASENIESEYVKKAVGDCFDAFINVLVNAIDDDFGKIGFVGSIACTYKGILLQHLQNHNIKCEIILKNPMDGLIRNL